ncbi:hypothetical protein OIU77_011960 [Salix suchowensis]|uniref:Uncharacterized protein n=1 Tax=Salix suchowensis TaxID=1278906 RepID=A0ABQ9A229_9ROSI|nr:hypothetical protein OIU77_011960 [Salix suchowensis]
MSGTERGSLCLGCERKRVKPWVEEDCGNARQLVEKKRERENEESGEIRLRLLWAANEEKKNGKRKEWGYGEQVGESGDGEESEGEGERGSPERGPSFNFAGIS